MITCTFFGIRQCQCEYDIGVKKRLNHALHEIVRQNRDDDIHFLFSNTTDFELVAWSAVQNLKDQNPEVNIKTAYVGKIHIGINKYVPGKFDYFLIPKQNHKNSALYYSVEKADYLISYIYDMLSSENWLWKTIKRKNSIKILDITDPCITQQIWELLESFPEKDQYVIKMLYQGKTMKSIAQELGVTHYAIPQRFSRISRNIRDKLYKIYFPPKKSVSTNKTDNKSSKMLDMIVCSFIGHNSPIDNNDIVCERVTAALIQEILPKSNLFYFLFFDTGYFQTIAWNIIQSLKQKYPSKRLYRVLIVDEKEKEAQNFKTEGYDYVSYLHLPYRNTKNNFSRLVGACCEQSNYLITYIYDPLKIYRYLENITRKSVEVIDITNSETEAVLQTFIQEINNQCIKCVKKLFSLYEEPPSMQLAKCSNCRIRQFIGGNPNTTHTRWKYRAKK